MDHTRFRVRADRTDATPATVRRVAVASAVLLVLGVSAVFTLHTSAATTGTATARTADVEIAADTSGVPALDAVLSGLALSVTTPVETAPSALGSSTDTTGVNANAALATVATGAVTAAATRDAADTVGQSTIANANIGLLGTSVLQTGVITSTSTCPVGGTATATTSAVNVTAAGVPLNAAAGASANVPVTVAGLIGADVTVAVSSPNTAAAGSASGTGLLVNLTLHGILLAVPVSVPLGTVTLAASSCAAPNAALPTITALTPASGPTSGGQTVTITGTAFTSGSTVTFGGVPATGVTVVSPTVLTATAPAHAAGPVDVVVTSTVGSSAPSTYTYAAPSLTGIAPAIGSAAGGQAVTITGTGLAPTSAVTIGGAPATDVVVNQAGTQITAVTPAGAPGLADVVVTAGGTPEASLPAGYTYLPAVGIPPVIVAVTPLVGPTVGGQTVTITGTGFTSGASVSFGGVPAVDVSVVSATSLTAVTPAHAAGPATVVVTTTAGSSLPSLYTYLPIPVVTAVDPIVGPTTGGQTVTVTGLDFSADASVTFGGVPATGVVVAPDGLSLTAVTPAHAAGPVGVVVTTSGGSSLPLPFTYVAAPTAVLLNPIVGPTAGGQTVTVMGLGFSAGATVSFGGVPATDVVVAPDGTSLTAVTPANPAGPVGVVVTTAGGSSIPLPYTYLAAPVAALVTPIAGPTAGGQTVTVTGTGFTPTASVTFGGVPATDVVVAPDGLSLTAVTPANAAGPVGVVVTTAGGSSPPSLYTYVAPIPVAVAVNPIVGPTAGGQTVTIAGTGFTPDATVSFDGVPATDVVVDPDGQSLTAVTPAHAAGLIGVEVSTAAGTSLPVPYTYLSFPTAVLLDPITGPIAGGQAVTITGTGFTPDATVSFGGVPASAVTVLNPATLTAVTPAHAVGPVGVVVTTAGGSSLPLLYSYLAPVPIALTVDPLLGPTAGGQTVTVTGVGFTPDATVTFGGAPATDVVVAPDGMSLTAVTPAHAAAIVDVVVTTAGGSSLPLPYTYVAPLPVALVLDPMGGPTAGGQTVTISGTGFTPDATVSFGGVPATDVVVAPDGVSLTAVTPANAAGPVGVVVTTAAGSSLPLLYTYLAPVPPVTLGLTPPAGPTAGGQTVTITGTGFTPDATVAFGGVAATDVTVAPDGLSLTAVTPAHSAALVNVVVTTAAGSSGLLLFYTYVPVAVLTGLTPILGPTTGGQTVTIAGVGITPDSTVAFDGVPATDVVVAPDGLSLTAVTPAHAAGLVDVVVTTPGGDSTPLLYTYLAAPVVAVLSPLVGPAAGGQTVTVTGVGFTPDAAVSFDGVPATDVVVAPDGLSLTAVTPAHAAGPVDAVVTTPGGSSIPLPYVYVAAPEAVLLDPIVGPTAGGQTVTITGTGFTPTSTVSFGGDAATDVVVAPDGLSLTAVTPAHAAAPVDVVVTTAGGSSIPLPYAYVAAPEAVLLDPTVGPAAGGQTVTITGVGFTPTSTVSFGGDPATDVVVAPDGLSLTAVTPAHAAGPVDVVVTTAGGSSIPLPYTYVAPVAPAPTVSALNPGSGPTAGGQTVTITGTGFTPSATVSFGGVPATDVVVGPGGTSLTAVTPAHAAGQVDVVVTTLNGASAPLPYTYDAPSVAQISPASGPAAGGQHVTISGHGLSADSTVEIGGRPATDVVVNAAGTELTAVTPVGTAGAHVAVVISNASGPEVSVTDGYSYLPAPEVTGISPAVGPASGGQRVIITGSGFITGGTTVRFGSHAATDVVVLSDDRLSAVTPPGSGSVRVTVTDADGTGTSRGFYTYVLGETVTAPPGTTGTTGTGGGGNLPFTGFDALELLAVGACLVGVGAWTSRMAGRSRRRR